MTPALIVIGVGLLLAAVALVAVGVLLALIHAAEPVDNSSDAP